MKRTRTLQPPLGAMASQSSDQSSRVRTLLAPSSSHAYLPEVVDKRRERLLSLPRSKRFKQAGKRVVSYSKGLEEDTSQEADLASSSD
eukprot:4732954-Karenia_brevis.AAC.1